MTAVVGRVWGWVSPANLYSSWGSTTKPETPATIKHETKSGLWGLTSWVWRGENAKKDQKTITEEFWETEEHFKPLEVEELRALRPDLETEKVVVKSSPSWWRRMLPSRYFFGPGGHHHHHHPPNFVSRNVLGGMKAHGTVMRLMENQTTGHPRRLQCRCPKSQHSAFSLARGRGTSCLNITTFVLISSDIFLTYS